MKGNQLLLPIIAALGLFIISAILGLSMRAAFVIDIPEWFVYKNIQHAHSHVALLGWLFGIFYLVIISVYQLDFQRYKRLYWILQGTVLGMLLTFPIMGYASLSIVFSTLHIMLCFIFAYRVWRDISPISNGNLHILFLKASLVFLVVSTIGPLSLGPLMAMGLKGSPIYYAAIQFYLHFQFNGWFIFAMLGIFLAFLQSRGISINNILKSSTVFWTLILATILTFALAITWSTPRLGIFIINSIGVILQLIAITIFLKVIYTHRDRIKTLIPKYTYHVISIALFALLLKVLIQAIIVIPAMAAISYSIRNFVIGFIHLLMLGCLSLFIIGIVKTIIQKPVSLLGTSIFIGGIVLSEILLFTQGLMLWQKLGFIPYYYVILMCASSFILIGIIIITYSLILRYNERSYKPS